MTFFNHYSWFFPQLTNDDAIALLNKPLNDEGAFLIREDKGTENMVLYVKHDNSIVQYTIVAQRKSCFYVEIPVSDEEILYEHIFSSVEDLIIYYSEKKEDICTKLGRPCFYTSEWEIKAHEIDFQVCISTKPSEKIEIWNGVCGAYAITAKKLTSITVPRETIIEEVEVLKRLNHPNILMFHGVAFEKESIIIVTEHVSWQNLVEHFRDGGKSDLPLNISVLRQVLNGLNHLQQKTVAHLNFGTRSVLLTVTPGLQCKITNFEMARRIDIHKEAMTTEDIAIRWSAPEGSLLHANTDVYSFGIFMYQIFTLSQSSYLNTSGSELARQVKAGHQLSCPTSCPKQIYAIMKECWNIDPDARPNFESLRQRMRQLAVTLTVDGKPIPAPRNIKPQQAKPVPKPRKQQNYQNTTIFPPPLPAPNVVKQNQPPGVPKQSMKNMSLMSLSSLPSPPPRPQKAQNAALLELQINRKTVKLVSKIKQSPWDEIWEGVWNDNTHVSVTIPNLENFQRSEVIEQIELMKKFENPNVIKLYGVCTNGDPMYILTDLMKPGSLLAFLRSNKDTLQDDLLLQIGIQVARGMAYLHTHFVIHRDIRADNVLIDENNTCKIAGLRLFRRVDVTTHTFNGTDDEKIPVKWAAPEVIKHHVFSTRSDVWSFGIFLYELVTRGKFPYSGITNKDVVEKVVSGYRIPCPDDCPEEVHEIMLKCWNEKPDSRPSSIILPQMLLDLTETEDDELYDEEEDCYVHAFDDITELPEKDWTVNFSDLTLQEKLMPRESGDIWRGVFKESTQVAIKCIDADLMNNRIENRIEIMKQLQHQNLLELHGICSTDEVTYIITNFMQYGNLLTYLQNNANSLNSGDFVMMSYQCSKGMAFLEANGIIHGNLSASKVLVGEKMVCKISGICGADISQEDPYSGKVAFRIAPKWMAPETAINGVFQQQSDIWSFGILLYEIMSCGQDPYPGMSDEEVLDNIVRGYRMPCPPNCRQDVYDIMLECWNEDPSKRTEFEDIVTKLGDIETYDNLASDLLEEEETVEGKEIELQHKLSETTTGSIWTGTWKGDKVAIKCLNTFGADAELQKLELMKTLMSPHILRVFGVCSKNQSVCVAMELMSRGNLQDYIAWEGSSLSLEKQMEISVQCAKGMAFLDSQDIIHGNLTARNVLIGDKLSCKITGIIGKGVESEDPYTGDISFYIPYKWMPLETVVYDEFNKLSDIWSFGILLYEIMTYGDVPYPGMGSIEAVNKIREGYRMPCPPECPKDVHNIMMKCWNETPSQRPSFQDIDRRLEDICAYESMPVEEEWPWSIRHIDLSRRSKVDDSQSGEVWKGVFKGKIDVAIKCPTRDSVSAELGIAELMKSLKHPHILKVFGVCTKHESVWICTEFMDNKNLKNFILREGKALSMEVLVNFAAQCASGMMYLEEKDIIHGNLTARQILVSENMICKITGICGDGVAHEDPYEGAITFFLPIKWRAPETTKYDEFTVASDVWSFGIILHEIMSYGRDPYSGMSNLAALEAIQKGYRMECPPNCPRQVGGIMLECWTIDPDIRPRFDNISLRLKNQQKYMCEYTDNSSTIAKESWEVERSEVYFEQKLSEGKTGNIWKGLLHETKPVAIQVVIEKDNEWIKSMVKLKHPNILGIEAVCITPEETLIMTEFMQNDNLVSYLRSGGRSLKIQQFTHMAVQVCDGMMYLKRQGIVHRDLSARNVLVGEKLTCKITGILGDWTDVVDDPYYSDKVYTPPVKWAAPEAVLYGQFTFQSDVWSFGVVLYEIVTYGSFPYPGMTRYTVISKIQEGYRMPCPPNCPPPLYDVMRKCWKEEPSERCSIEALNKTLSEYYNQLSSAKDEFEITARDVLPEQKIGESEFGEELWRGQFCNNSVLIKYHSPDKLPMVDFLQEAEVLKPLVHENVIKLHGLCPKGNKVFIVLDYMNHSNMLQYLQAVGCSVSHATMLQMSCQVANGMEYLQKQGVIHRNLSASSIMVSDDMMCKISNFHQALVRNQRGTLSKDKQGAKVRWMPVEVLSDDRYSMKSDVWSYGMFLYELASWGETPYPGMTNKDVCEKVPDGYRMSSPPVCPIGLHEIMLQCWKENPLERPTFDQLQKSVKNLISQDKRWETDSSEVTVKHKLGVGRFSEVWSGHWRGSQVAVKYLKAESCTLELFLWEAQLMKTLEHPHVVKLHALCSKTERPFMIIEALHHSLLRVLRQKNNTLKLVELMTMAIQVASGMIYLQGQKIIHRDLAARSILVGSGNVCKVSDFSEAIIHGRAVTQAQKDKRLPIRWTAPESALTKQFTLKSDVWSFGILLHEMVKNGELPYTDIKENVNVVTQLKSGYRMPCPSNCPQNVYKVMQDCWNKDPESRPEFQSIHDTLQKIQDDMKWEVESNETDLIRVIGTGRFGEVWEGQFKDTTVAVKCHKPMTNIRDEFLWEAEIMKTLQHPHVIRLVGMNSKADNAFMVIEFMKHGTLLEYVKSIGRTLTLRTLMAMAAQVADGMGYLQTQSIIHRDLAARSVLVGENNVCKVSDFSEVLCTSRTDNPEYKGRNYPIKWMAPEAVATQVFSMHTDIWSYGILLYEIVTNGAAPYPGMKQKDVLQNISNGYRMPIPTGCPEDIYRVMTECWKENPTARPSFETVQLQVQRISETCKNVPAVRTRTKEMEVERKRGWSLNDPVTGDDMWELDRRDVKLDAEYEEGRFGVVWKGYLKDGELVAIKIPKLDRTSVSEFLHESEIMKTLRHPNVIRLRGVCTKGEPIYIITEFMAHSNMIKYLRGPGRRTPMAQLLVWANQICNAMTYLEQCNIIHRDVAARNILISEKLVCKVSDFGLAQKVSGSTYKESSRTQFPLKWMAPETIAHRSFSIKSDVWAFGILLYEMVTHGALPYPGVNNSDVAQLVKEGYRMPCPRGCPKGIYEIMLKCWEAKAEERPNFSALGVTFNSV